MVALVIALALFFDFTNGFHDTANAMATPIATGALKPKVAVAIAAILNLVGAFLSTEVAKTISGGLIREGDGGIQITPQMIFAGLIGAIMWNLVTWLLGLPSSSSHALFGGLIGAVVVGVGFGAIDAPVLVSKIVLPALFAPLIAGVVAFAATRIAYTMARPPTARRTRRREQGLPLRPGVHLLARRARARHQRRAEDHGGHHPDPDRRRIPSRPEAARNSGSSPSARWRSPSALTPAAGGSSAPSASASPMSRPRQGFAAEAATTATILASSHLGFALSTTQVASGSIIGAGLGKRNGTVRWRIAGRIAMAWLITLPASAAMAACAELVARLGPHRGASRTPLSAARSSSSCSCGRGATGSPPVT